ncbi:MAG: site-2 protease family protein [Cytophagales bacterium]|nr:site-2 protease family protein [Cytophagales bacterium]
MKSDKTKKTLIIQIILFIATGIGTTIAGAEWMYGKSLLFGEVTITSSELLAGLYFSVPFLGILTAHEFGHFLTAKYYKVKVTLPYYIPLWLGFLPMPSIGTMGAFIRIKGLIESRKEYFDIGIAGPLAGFVIALLVLTYGFTNLPDADYIFEIHPEYREYGPDYEKYVYADQEVSFVVGDNLLFLFFENFVADPEKVPNNYEMYHYPWLFAGYLALFFTALNLIPIGQLDGGHVIYGLFGHRKGRIVSRVLFILLVLVSGVGLIPSGPINTDFLINAVFYLLFLYLALHHFEKYKWKRLLYIIWIMTIQIIVFNYFPVASEYGIYMVFAFLIGRFLGVDHPKAIVDKPLDLKRKVIGWIALVIFVVSFTPRPLYLEINEKARIEKPGLEEKDRDPSEIIARGMIKRF